MDSEIHARKPGTEVRLCDGETPEPFGNNGGEVTCPECNEKAESLRKFLEG
jgi:hypothetical protein